MILDGGKKDPLGWEAASGGGSGVEKNGRTDVKGGRPSSTDLSHLNPRMLGRRLTLLIWLLLASQRAVDDGVSIPVERGRSVNHPVPDHVTVRLPSIPFLLA